MIWMQTMIRPDPLPDWYSGDGLNMPGPGRFLFTTQRYPIFYLQITKCGCTFLRNLLYYLDNKRVHPDSSRIHSHEQDFLKADMIPRAVLLDSPYLFAVIRDPVDRFLSLYFDKLANRGSFYDHAMRARVSNAAGLDQSPELDLEGHRQNCLKTLYWFGLNLDTKRHGKPNPHWQRQSVRLSRMEGLKPRLLTLDDLSWQLPQLLAPIIPDIETAMSAVKSRNTTQKPFSRDEMLTPELEAAVYSVYRDDADRYARVRSEWAPAPETGG